jgi:S-adenosylmethionine:tRNA ribosyltransferase-isomerase
VKVADLDYPLDETLIAAEPAKERDASRLLVLPCEGALVHQSVRDLGRWIPEGALLVMNDTRVVPARLVGKKETGGVVEVFLVERTEGPADARWRALVGSNKPVRPGARIAIEGCDGFVATLLAPRDEAGLAEVELTAPIPVLEAIEQAGRVPLPPYIKREPRAEDAERYQTVYARKPGAVAAPTAGLHLTERLLAELAGRGVETTFVTLHVSLGTFAPVKVADLDDHPMHAEEWEVSEEASDAIARARARGKPVVAVGTTTVRVLESCRSGAGLVKAGRGFTRLLIQPGFQFGVVDALLTNFHLPRSTLLALVGAACGLERMFSAYAEAVRERYRFFSYGDAMFLAPGTIRRLDEPPP